MDMKSLLQQKVKSSLNSASTQKKERLNRIEMSVQVFNDVSNAVRQLSREIAQYNSGISLKVKYDSIVLHYKYGSVRGYSSRGPLYYDTVYWSREGNYDFLYVRDDVFGDTRFEDAKSAINWITEWCAERITHSMSERGRSAKRRAIFLKTVILTTVALLILLFIKE